MTFDDMVGQILTLLQRQGRVSYRALQRRLQIADDYLQDLKSELLYVYPAVEDDGQGLVWTGDVVKATEETLPPPLQATSPTPAWPDQPAPGPARAPVLQAPDAERRQLTVMFCDLVDSTPLSGTLDPEDLREVIQAYQQVCAEVIARFDGHIAQYLGDGLLVYFGYPQAHEADAQSAVRAGLAILEALQGLNAQLARDKDVRLAIRVGIHTGLTVVGTMGAPGHQEQLALGETPNIAARIQHLAEPNTVVVSQATYHLVQGYFTCGPLQAYALKGIPHLLSVCRVLGESGVHNRLDALSPRGLTPLVGREQEIGLLAQRWAYVQEGQGQVVLLSGEGGIGKSRLLRVMKDQLARGSHTQLECRSAPYYQHTALYPITDLLQRTLRWHQQEGPEAQLQQLETMLQQHHLPLPEVVPLLAALFSLPLPAERYMPLTLSPQRQRHQTLAALLALLGQYAARQPLLFIMEDLHWVDPTTLELLDLLIDQTPTASLMVLLTCRPAWQPTWLSRSYVTQVTLNRLSTTQVAQLIAHLTDGKALSDALVQQIIAKTDGVPLFVEEITKAVLESGMLHEVDGHYTVQDVFSPLAIPATLQDSLMARLDRLVTAKAVAQYAAVIGRQFSYELLQAVSQLDAETLRKELRRLIEAELLYQRGLPPHAMYTFKHALVQDAAYQSLLKRTRQRYHQRVAEVLMTQFPDTARTQPELLAYHCTAADLSTSAVEYWRQAGQSAIERSAYAEALGHLQKGLTVLKEHPDMPECLPQELLLDVALGVALAATAGFASGDTARVYARARELCRQVGETPQLFPVLRGLWRFYNARAEFRTAQELGEQLLHLAQRVQDAGWLLAAHCAVGTTLMHRGELRQARAHFEEGIALYDLPKHRPLLPLYGEDFGVVCLARVAVLLWMLGDTEQARQKSAEAIDLAHALSYPFSQVYALTWAAILQQCLRQGHATQECAETAIGLAQQQGLVAPLALLTIIRGGALAAQAQFPAGIAQIVQGMQDFQSAGATIGRPYYIALLAEAYGQEGRHEEGLTLIEDGLRHVDTTDERWWEAELYRLKGVLLATAPTPNGTAAAACLHQALEIASRQGAQALKERAAASLCCLAQHQEKTTETPQVLARA